MASNSEKEITILPEHSIVKVSPHSLHSFFCSVVWIFYFLPWFVTSFILIIAVIKQYGDCYLFIRLKHQSTPYCLQISHLSRRCSIIYSRWFIANQTKSTYIFQTHTFLGFLSHYLVMEVECCSSLDTVLRTSSAWDRNVSHRNIKSN